MMIYYIIHHAKITQESARFCRLRLRFNYVSMPTYMEKRTKIGLSLLLAVLVLLIIASDKATPDSTLTFGLKRLQEKIFLSLKPTPEAKADYYLALLDKRLEELKGLVKNKRSWYLWSASLRYSATAGELTDLVLQNNLTDKVGIMTAQFKNHQQVLRAAVDNYPDAYSQEDWKFLQDDINYLELYLEKLKSL